MITFDYRTAAREAGITDEQLARLLEMMRADFPHDEMMVELHVLQACETVLEGEATIEEILADASPVETRS